MKEYPKIDTIFKRTERGKIIVGDYSQPEFEYLKDLPWVWTEKVDGTNIRIMWDGKDIQYGGKTDNAQIPTKLINWLGIQELDNGDATFNSYTFHRLFGGEGNVCLYGEGYGAGIQKGGGNYSQEQKFVLFDVKIGDWWLQRKDIIDIAQKLILPVVPIILEGSILLALELIMNDVVQSTWGDFKAEGLVGTPKVPLFNRKGERIITKIKAKDFKNV